VGKLGLVERFWSVQGEGENAGWLAFFVRFAGCNLDCHFGPGSRCDTPWQKARVKMSLDDLLEEARRFEGVTRNGHGPMAVVTGGEPTMAPGFDDVVSGLQSCGLYTAVETNGTRWREGLARADWVACSPKDQVRQLDPLQSANLDPNVVPLVDEFRFVVTGPETKMPPVYHPRAKYYVSPAMEADGEGLEHLKGVPVFLPGAMGRCLEIIQTEPRFRLSLQTHKWTRMR
jgi:7-carboxy-7-deazaguanine synthase